MMKKPIISTIITIVNAVFPTAFAQSVSWKIASVPAYNYILDVSFSRDLNRFVAVGPYSAVYWSDDGLDWKPVQSPIVECNLSCTAYAFGKFYAGGESGGKAILLESEDGKKWFDTNQIFPGYYYYDVADKMTELRTVIGADGSEYLVCSTYDKIDSSDATIGCLSESRDGISWEPRQRSSNAIFKGIHAQNNGYFFKREGYPTYWSHMKAGSSSSTRIQGDYPTSPIPDKIDRIALGNDSYVGAGRTKSLGYLDSDPQKNWISSATSFATTDFTGVAYGNGFFIVVGQNGAAAISFDDARSWISLDKIRNAFGPFAIRGISFLDGRFFVYGEGGTIAVGTPLNNSEWSEALMLSGVKSVTAIAVSDDCAVAVSQGGRIYRSTSGKFWQLCKPVTSNNLNKIIFDRASNLFIATGEKGTVLRSSNGISWSSSVTGSSSTLNGAARLGKSLYSLGPSNVVMESGNDGATWRRIPSTQITRSVVEVTSAGETLFAVADRGNCFVSNKGSDFWRSRPIMGMTGRVFAGAAFDGKYYIAGEKGQIVSAKISTAFTASNVSWSKVQTNTTYNLRDIVQNGDVAKQFAAVGDGGTVFRKNTLDGSWGIDRIDQGKPQLKTVVWYPKAKVWIVGGQIGSNGVIYYTHDS